MHINPNKLYLALDLHIDMGQQIFKELAVKADIIRIRHAPWGNRTMERGLWETGD